MVICLYPRGLTSRAYLDGLNVLFNETVFFREAAHADPFALKSIALKCLNEKHSTCCGFFKPIVERWAKPVYQKSITLSPTTGREAFFKLTQIVRPKSPNAQIQSTAVNIC